MVPLLSQPPERRQKSSCLLSILFCSLTTISVYIPTHNASVGAVQCNGVALNMYNKIVPPDILLHHWTVCHLFQLYLSIECTPSQQSLLSGWGEFVSWGHDMAACWLTNYYNMQKHATFCFGWYILLQDDVDFNPYDTSIFLQVRHVFLSLLVCKFAFSYISCITNKERKYRAIVLVTTVLAVLC